MDLWELESISKKILENGRKYSLQCYLLFSFMSYYGLRFSDVYSSEWIESKENPDFITIIQQKTGKARRIARWIVLDSQEIDVYYIRKEAQKYSYSYYRTYFIMFSPFVLINDEGKKIETHLFRHIKAKQIFHETKDIKLVKEGIGVSSTSVAWDYVRSVITKA